MINQPTEFRKTKPTALIEKILTNNENIAFLHLRLFHSPPVFSQRGAFCEMDDKISKLALALRDQTSMPYPDALNSIILKHYTPSIELLKAIRFHNSNHGTIRISREKILNGELKRVLSNNEPDVFVGVQSNVLTYDGTTLHIPMIDFHIHPSKRAVSIIQNITKMEIGDSGWLLDSGRSYHYIGNSLLNEDEFKTLLYRLILYSPITDKNWIVHQLIENYCTLRISPNPRTSAEEPYVVKRFIQSKKSTPQSTD